MRTLLLLWMGSEVRFVEDYPTKYPNRYTRQMLRVEMLPNGRWTAFSSDTRGAPRLRPQFDTAQQALDALCERLRDSTLHNLRRARGSRGQ